MCFPATWQKDNTDTGEKREPAPATAALSSVAAEDCQQGAKSSPTGRTRAAHRRVRRIRWVAPKPPPHRRNAQVGWRTNFALSSTNVSALPTKSKAASTPNLRRCSIQIRSRLADTQLGQPRSNVSTVWRCPSQPQNFADGGRIRQSSDHLVDIVRNMGEFCTMLPRISPNAPQRTKVGPFRSKHGRNRPKLAEFGNKLAKLGECRPNSTGRGPISANLGPDSPKLCRLRKILDSEAIGAFPTK